MHGCRDASFFTKLTRKNKFQCGSCSVNFPAKFNGETEFLHSSRDIRARKVNFPTSFSGETKFVRRLHNARSRNVNFFVKLSEGISIGG